MANEQRFPEEFDEAFLAYVAGLFDGEGCLHAGMRSKFRGSVQLFITISNVYRPVLEELEKAFGGSIHKQSGGVRQCWTWRLSVGPAKWVVPLLLPYLRIKEQQAHMWLNIAAMQERKIGALPRVTEKQRQTRVLAVKELQLFKKAA